MTKNPCEALLGKIFGHKWRGFLVYKGPPTRSMHDLGVRPTSDYTLSLLASYEERSKEKRYKYVCLRCGLRIEDDNNG